MAFASSSAAISELAPIVNQLSNTLRTVFSTSRSHVHQSRSTFDSCKHNKNKIPDASSSSVASFLSENNLTAEQAKEAVELINLCRNVSSKKIDECNLNVCINRLAQFAASGNAVQFAHLGATGNLGLHPPKTVTLQKRGFKSGRDGHSYYGLGGSRSKAKDAAESSSGIGSIFSFDKPTTESSDLKDLLDKNEKNPQAQGTIVEAYRRGIILTLKHMQEERYKWLLIRFFVRTAITGVLLFCLYRLYTNSAKDGGGISRLLDTKSKWGKDTETEVSDKRFSDVVGCDEAKKELEDIVDFLRHPHKYTDLGARLPKGVLLVGSPGVGKTLMAKAVAGEAGVPFYQASGAEFDEVFVGVGSMRIRQLFENAKLNAPCIIFIDEIDTVGGKRISSPTHPYANQTVNQLLNEMDGFKDHDSVIVIGATNFVDHLDGALLRPGRFDLHITVNLPDREGRIGLLKLYLNKVVHQLSEADIERLADITIGMSGADIDSMVNQATIMTGLTASRAVRLSHMQEAYDKVAMGTKRSRIKLDKVNENTAAHEAGHALVNMYTDGAPPLNKVTILPRGMSLGHTAMRPTEEQQYGSTKKELLARIDTCMGGRIGEELYYGKDGVSTGAGHDFKQATSIAENMVMAVGMSDKIGPRNVRKASESLKQQADVEVDRLLKEGYNRAKKILEDHAEEHKLLTAALMKYETLDLEDVQRVIKGLLPMKSSGRDGGNTGSEKSGDKPKLASGGGGGILTGWLPRKEKDDSLKKEN